MKNRILILSTWDNQGSGAASYKISRFLIEAGYDVVLAVRDKTRLDPFIIHVPYKSNSLLKRSVNKIKGFFAPKMRTKPEYSFLNPNEHFAPITANAILSRLPFTPHLILGGLTSGFVNTKTLADLKEATGAKVYMLNIDMSPLTGGCHYSWECKGYETDCNTCPAITDEQYKQQAKKNFLIKLKYVRKADIKILAGSGWTYLQAKRSTLFKDQKIIHNTNSCIDVRVFNDRNRSYAKQIFGIPEGNKVIFMGASFTNDKRKGIPHFVEALKLLWNDLDEESKQNTLILIASRSFGNNEYINQIPFEKNLIDFITDERLLALAYQAADVFVCPSIQDAGPMMVSEALACGTPVVGFEMGVVMNMVINGFNGYQARLGDSADLAFGIKEILALSGAEFQQYSKNAYDHVVKYSSQYTLVDIIGKILNEDDPD